MKNILTLVVFISLFLGCADKNAFNKFNMPKDQELSIENLQSSKIKLKEETKGIFSAIYLNKIYPEVYNDAEYFYVFLYQKDTNKQDKFSSIEKNIKLNKKLPLKVEKLPPKNKFSRLTSISNEWNKYYLVSFKKDKKDKLNLVFENGQFSSDQLVYQKDLQ